VDLHIPHRPSWRCRVDATPWPCETARRQLLAEYDGARISLHLYLAANLVEASGHLPDVPSGQLWERFIGWAHEPRHRARG
jgi:hypothetical protein